MIDVNDMMAAENRRQEIAVRAGVSIRAVKAEPSIFKELQVKWLEAFFPMEVNREFGKVMAETKFPGYNFGATLQDIAKLTPEQQHTEEEAIAEWNQLLADSVENELKVTRTSTGQPKVDESGNVVPPIQSEEGTPEADSTKKAPVAKPPVATPVVVVKDSDKK